jgi:GAF domain-containing protein
MTDRLRNVIGGLEDLVKLRTSQLEARTDQIQAASRLGSAATSILDPEELTRQVVQMIQEQFELSYVGLFLVDEAREYATLQAGTGEAEQAKLEPAYRIKVGQGLVGWCIQDGQSRVSQSASETDLNLAMPDLPEAHSEAAIPLRSRGQVLGAITMQSKAPGAFDESTLLTFQTLADQIAIAIDNARLFEEAQKALEATRQAYGELSHQAWMQRLNSQGVHVTRSREGLWYEDSARRPGNSKSNPGNGKHQAETTFELPIEVRGMIIGTLRAKKSEGEPYWSREERELLATMGEQLGVALESARLFEETLLRAERERLIGDITNRVRETLDIDTVLKTAAKEMQKVLDLEEVEVRMNKA